MCCGDGCRRDCGQEGGEQRQGGDPEDERDPWDGALGGVHHGHPEPGTQRDACEGAEPGREQHQYDESGPGRSERAAAAEVAFARCGRAVEADRDEDQAAGQGQEHELSATVAELAAEHLLEVDEHGGRVDAQLAGVGHVEHGGDRPFEGAYVGDGLGNDVDLSHQAVVAWDGAEQDGLLELCHGGSGVEGADDGAVEELSAHAAGPIGQTEGGHGVGACDRFLEARRAARGEPDRGWKLAEEGCAGNGSADLWHGAVAHVDGVPDGQHPVDAGKLGNVLHPHGGQARLPGGVGEPDGAGAGSVDLTDHGGLGSGGTAGGDEDREADRGCDECGDDRDQGLGTEDLHPSPSSARVPGRPGGTSAPLMCRPSVLRRRVPRARHRAWRR